MKNVILKKLLAVALSLAVGATFIPLLGDGAYAADTQENNPDVVVADEPAEQNGADDIDISVEEPAPGENDIVDITDGEAADETAVPEEAAPAAEQLDTPAPPEEDVAEEHVYGGGNAKHLYIPALMDDSDDGKLSAQSVSLGAVDPKLYTVNITQSGNTVKFSASIDPNYCFINAFVDTTAVYKPFSLSNVSSSFNIGGYATTGYHTVSLMIAKASNPDEPIDFVGRQFISCNNITAAPNYNGKFYYVYSKYFDYFPFDFGKNLGGTLYLEYKKSGWKTWKRTGAMKANAIKLYMDQGFKISGLSPNKKYKTRIRYGTYVTYSTDYAGDGKSYFFGGPVRNTTTIKTGMPKKPKVKSLKVKAVKVKRHKVKHYGYYTGVYLYTEKYYTYKVKVTVKLKKKPGAKGLWINGKFVKGNKKKYTVTLPGSTYSSKKPKGKKFTVAISSYKSKSYGGLSPLYKKVKKIK